MSLTGIDSLLRKAAAHGVPTRVPPKRASDLRKQSRYWPTALHVPGPAVATPEPVSYYSPVERDVKKKPWDEEELCLRADIASGFRSLEAALERRPDPEPMFVIPDDPEPEPPARDDVLEKAAERVAEAAERVAELELAHKAEYAARITAERQIQVLLAAKT